MRKERRNLTRSSDHDRAMVSLSFVSFGGTITARNRVFMVLVLSRADRKVPSTSQITVKGLGKNQARVLRCTPCVG